MPSPPKPSPITHTPSAHGIDTPRAMVAVRGHSRPTPSATCKVAKIALNSTGCAMSRSATPRLTVVTKPGSPMFAMPRTSAKKSLREHGRLELQGSVEQPQHPECDLKAAAGRFHARLNPANPATPASTASTTTPADSTARVVGTRNAWVDSWKPNNPPGISDRRDQRGQRAQVEQRAEHRGDAEEPARRAEHRDGQDAAADAVEQEQQADGRHALVAVHVEVEVDRGHRRQQGRADDAQAEAEQWASGAGGRHGRRLTSSHRRPPPLLLVAC